MRKYYTRACNFYFGKISKNLVKEKKTLPLNGNPFISFDKLELISKKSKKKIPIKKINILPNKLKKKIREDIKNIKKKKKFKNLNLDSSHYYGCAEYYS